MTFLLVLFELLLFDAGIIALDSQNGLRSFLRSQELGMKGAVRIEEEY